MNARHTRVTKGRRGVIGLTVRQRPGDTRKCAQLCTPVS